MKGYKESKTFILDEGTDLDVPKRGHLSANKFRQGDGGRLKFYDTRGRHICMTNFYWY